MTAEEKLAEAHITKRFINSDREACYEALAEEVKRYEILQA